MSSISTPLWASDRRPPTFLILIQYTIIKSTASHFINGVITRQEAAAKRATRKYRNTVETNTNPASRIDQKRRVVVLAGQWCFNRCATPPRWNIGDSTRGLEQCHDHCTTLVGIAPPCGWRNADQSSAQPHGNKQKLRIYATTAEHRPGAGHGKHYRPLTVPLGTQGRGHGTRVVSKARGRASRPNIAREGLA